MVFCYLQAYGYSKIGITLCPSEWYQYLNFWYLAHGLIGNKQVEDEMHFLCECPAYEIFREKFLQTINKINCNPIFIISRQNI